MAENKFRLIHAIIMAMLIWSGCDSSDDIPITIAAPGQVTIKDIANFKDGRDLQLSFVKPADVTMIKEFRIFLVPDNLSPGFDSLSALTEDQFLLFGVDDESAKIEFPATQNDIEGNPITEQVAYRAFVLAVATDESGLGGALSNPSNMLTLQQKNVVRTLTATISAGSGGMDVDAAGNIYMADFGATTGGNPVGTRVFKITPEGSVSVFANGLNGASGNDFDADGNLLQSNIAGGSVSKIEPNGNVSTIATGFSGPVGITVAESGDFFVCNCSNNSISKVTPDGTVSTFIVSALLNCPNGIDMDSVGNLYIANFSSSNLVKITPDAQASVLAVMPGNNNGHLLIHGEFIYVISRGIHQIHRVTFDGIVTLFAGSGARGIIDGPPEEAGFSLPNDLAFSPDGKMIYINDVNGSNPDGTVISPTIIRVIELVE